MLNVFDSSHILYLIVIKIMWTAIIYAKKNKIIKMKTKKNRWSRNYVGLK